jgi:anti-sigma regulatory factor (Ser/Thr protein kinase)
MTPVRLRHDAFVYGCEEQFATRMSRFIADGLDEGAATVAVTSRSNWAALCDALGERARSVQFTDRDSVYVRPARTLAAYDATLRHHLDTGAPSVRVVGEVQFGPTAAEWSAWTAYEAIFNHAFAHYPAWIVCPYDTRALPDAVVENAWRTHPEVMGEAVEVSSLFDEPADLVRALTPEPPPLALPSLGRFADAQTFRETLARELSAAPIREQQALDMLVAASEVFANAVRHGGGVSMLRAGVVEGVFVCEISDDGPGTDDPLAGYLPPRPDEGRGAGLWIARQLVSRLELLSSGSGLTVRLWL